MQKPNTKTKQLSNQSVLGKIFCQEQTDHLHINVANIFNWRKFPKIATSHFKNFWISQLIMSLSLNHLFIHLSIGVSCNVVINHCKMLYLISKSKMAYVILTIINPKKTKLY